MKLAVISDQISRDVDTACEQITSWGGHHVELRVVGEGPIGSNLSPSFLTGLVGTLEHWDVAVSGIAPQAFKVAMDDPAMRYHRRILLPASLHLALLLKCPVVHIGAPLRPAGAKDPCPDAVLEVLAEAAELAGNLGVVLGLENEPGSWAETSSHLAAITRAVGHHALQISWDPAVSLMAGDAPFPSGLMTVKNRLVSVRLRDVGRSASGYHGVLPGDGMCGLDFLVTSLVGEGFAGSLALDPRLSPRLEGARAAYETVEKMALAARRAKR
ncbi:MAG TPA: TIM barrel protein [Symbiobacteriaceae bacterium]|nr:TIM barrel protein [Symbiobacteriaceae bacterium]